MFCVPDRMKTGEKSEQSEKCEKCENLCSAVQTANQGTLAFYSMVVCVYTIQLHWRLLIRRRLQYESLQHRLLLYVWIQSI